MPIFNTTKYANQALNSDRFSREVKIKDLISNLKINCDTNIVDIYEFNALLLILKTKLHSRAAFLFLKCCLFF